MADYATLLRDHVTLTCRSVDRIFLQAYVPRLQSVGGVCQFLYWQKGFGIPSSAAFGKIGDAYVAEVHRRAKAHGVPVRRFAKGENKEQIARPLIEAAAREGGDGRVVLIGIAQEKTPMWRSWKAKGQEHVQHPHMEWGRQMGFVNQFYFYLWDPEWGGAFWKTNAYAPWPVWVWLNGHSWAQRQCERLGIGYTALDNGFRDCDDPAALQKICDRLGSGAGKSFFWRWQRRLPSPLTPEDVRAGYLYELAFRQFEISDTRVFDRPAAGRSFFEQLIRDHLDVGRPESVSLIFDRRINSRTPGTWRTKVITKRVDPQISCYYKSSRIKQYFKEHRALRTETVICDTRDFGIGRRVTAENWKALRAVGENANQRLCDAQATDARPAPDVATFTQVTRPSQIDGQHAPALPFGDPRVMAVLAAVVGFTHLLAGFGNPALVRTVSTVLGRRYTSRQATYDLRRLKRKGLIVRLPGHHRYQLTPLGRRVAVLFTKVYGRVLAPGLAELDPRIPTYLAHRSDLAQTLGGNSTDASINSQTQHSPQPEPQLGLIVNSALTKRSWLGIPRRGQPRTTITGGFADWATAELTEPSSVHPYGCPVGGEHVGGPVDVRSVKQRDDEPVRHSLGDDSGGVIISGSPPVCWITPAYQCLRPAIRIMTGFKACLLKTRTASGREVIGLRA